MKYIILILLSVLFFSIKGYSQYPKPNQTIGTDSNVVQAKGGLQGRVINITYADTTAANIQRIKDYPGAQIFTTSGSKMWKRNSAATQWIEMGSGAGSNEYYYGTIYNQKGWVTLDTFIATNVTASVVGGLISLAGGSSATDFTHTLDLKYQTAVDRWKIIIKFVPTTKDASSFGIGIGTHATSQWAGHGFDIVAQLNLSSGINSGIISLQNNNGSSYTSVATSGALTFSANDTILLSLERKQDSLISVAQDLTSGSIVRANYQYITTAATNPMPNTGYFSLRSFGGTQLIDSMSVTSKAIKNAALMIGSDSKGYYFATAYKNVFGNLVDHNLWSTNLNGGAAETTKDILHRLPELQALAPRQFILETYANDLRSGMTQQQSFDSITLIYNTLTSYGIDVLFLPLYETSENLLPWYQFFKANWPTKVIESYQVLQTPGLLVDGTHFSTAGQDTLSKIIINSFKVQSGNNRYEQYNTLQGVTDAGNTTTNNIGINVTNPTIPLQVVHPTSAPAISGSISANTGTEVLKIENTNSGASAASAIRFYNNSGLNAQLALGSSANSVNPNGISFHSFTGPMRIGSNSDVFEIFTGALGPSQANVKARMMNDGRMAIGVNPTPATSALLDVTSTTLGFLTPKMTTTQQNAIVSPTSGLLIFNTDSLKHCYYTGSTWVCYGSGSTASTPTFQQVLTAGSTLSGGNTISGGTSWQQSQSSFYRLAASSIDLNSDSVRIFVTTTATDTTTNKPALIDINTGTVRRTWWGTFGGGSTYTFSTGLTNTAGTVTNNLSTGVSGGQSLIGGTAANDLLTINGNNSASSNTATNPNIKFGVGNSGGTTAGQIHNNGVWAMGTVANADASTYRLVIQQLDNTANDGIIIYPNANTATNMMIGYGNIICNSSDFRITGTGGPIKLNSSSGIYIGGTGTPNSTAQVNGSFSTAYASTATSLSLGISNQVLAVTATGQTITLPTAVGITGRYYTIKLTASGSCTIATTSSQNIDASTTYSLSAQYKYVTVVSDGANWIIVANN